MIAFAVGLRSALRGLALGWRNREVRRSYGQLVVAALLLALGIEVASVFGIVRLTAIRPDAPWWQAAALLALEGLGVAAVFLATPLLLLVATNLALPLLSERVFFAALRTLDPERARALQAAPGLSGWSAALGSAVRLLRLAGVTLALLVVAFVPGIGVPLAAALQLYFTARTLAWELLDPYFTRRGMRLEAQRRFVREHAALLAGFGVPLALLLAVPVVGPLLFGLAQAAAARLIHDAIP